MELIISIVNFVFTVAVLIYLLKLHTTTSTTLNKKFEYVLTKLNNHKKVIVNISNHILSEQPENINTRKTKPLAVTTDILANQKELNDHLPLTGHKIIVGQTGSGKSNVAMSQIIRMLKQKYEIYIIDTKNELTPIFGRVVHCVPGDKAKEVFDKAIAIADKRSAMFAEETKNYKKPIRDYEEYYKVTGEYLNPVIIFIEELIVTMDLISQDELIKLLVTGRSAGVFVVALSQYLKSDILDRKATVNFNTRVFLGSPDRIAMGILFTNLDREIKTKAMNFLGKPGTAMIQSNDTYAFKHMPRVTEDYLIPFLQEQHD